MVCKDAAKGIQEFKGRRREVSGKPNCPKCGYFKDKSCPGYDVEWEERVSICVANGVEEVKAWQIACLQMRGKTER